MGADLMSIVDFIIHIDLYLVSFASDYGSLVYGILFFIIFLETGLVVAPFLPGDSLLFASGALASAGALNIILVFFLLSLAAILGDSVNYWIGNIFGKRLLRADTENPRFIKKEYIARTEKFYEKYGGRAIIIARFIPIIRTFAPFVAGLAKMNYGKFALYNISGGILWVGLFTIGGYLFGNIPLIKDNFSIAVIAIIILSVIPLAIEILRK